MPENEQGVTELAETLHRARNDLTTIASMLQLQARMSGSDMVSDALLAACSRVMAITRVNEALDRTTREEPTIDAVGFLRGIVADLKTAAEGRAIVKQAVQQTPLFLPVSYARPLGLVTNEWVTNALKYAFPEQRAGTVSIELTVLNQACTLTVYDDGIGFDPKAPPRGTGLGTRLARGLAKQLRGEVTVEEGAGGGTRCLMRFPRP